jgi:predicted acylesterase/phospholipase RssA
MFSPLLHNGDTLVDGGVMNNFPVDVMHELLDSHYGSRHTSMAI